MRLSHPILLKTTRAVCGALFMLAALAAPVLADLPPPPTSAPEIDPGSMLSALTLMAGGVLMVTDRCRRRK